MADVQAFQNALLSDPEVQAEFARNPQAVIERYGVTLPEGTQLPDSIPLPELQERVDQIRKGLEEQHTTLEEIASGGSSAVTSFVEKAVPLSDEDAETMKSVQEEFEEDVAAFQLRPTTQQTYAIVVGVVVAVVVAAVPGPDTTDSAQMRR